jgi:hypothetical protein
MGGIKGSRGCCRKKDRLRAGGSSGDEKEGARMGLRLQTDDGKIKEYHTAYGVDLHPTKSEYSYKFEKWVTKCGRTWYYKPEPHQECDHLDCAIYLVAEHLRANKWSRRFLAAMVVISFVITVIADLKGVSWLAAVSFLYLVPFSIGAIFSLNWRSKQIIGRFLAAIAVIFFVFVVIEEIRFEIGLVKYTFMISIISAFLAICFWGSRPGVEERLDELNEFKNNGTIKGIKAHQIFEDPHSLNAPVGRLE